MIDKISKSKEICFICNCDVLIDKKGYFKGVKDHHCYSKPLCDSCSKVWDKYAELLNEDKSNFNEYANIIINFVGTSLTGGQDGK